jgi:hypothetical protein
MKDYRDILAVPFTNPMDDPANHPFSLPAMVAVVFPGAKDRIYQQPIPGHLKRTKAFVLFVGGVCPFTLSGFVVVHGHGVNVQNHYRGLPQEQSPHKKFLQDATARPDHRPGKGLYETLHRMGRGHVFWLDFNGSRVPFVLFQVVEVSQMTTRAVHEKTKQLLKNAVNRCAFLVLPQSSKLDEKKIVKDLCFIQIPDKEAEASSARDAFIGWFDSVDPGFTLTGNSVNLFHLTSTFWVNVSSENLDRTNLDISEAYPIVEVSFMK